VISTVHPSGRVRVISTSMVGEMCPPGLNFHRLDVLVGLGLIIRGWSDADEILYGVNRYSNGRGRRHASSSYHDSSARSSPPETSTPPSLSDTPQVRDHVECDARMKPPSIVQFLGLDHRFRDDPLVVRCRQDLVQRVVLSRSWPSPPLPWLG
jgi:hypothetical protein